MNDAAQCSCSCLKVAYVATYDERTRLTSGQWKCQLCGAVFVRSLAGDAWANRARVAERDLATVKAMMMRPRQEEELAGLAEELTSILMNYCGETGASEGAVDTLDRLCLEIEKSRAHNAAEKDARVPQDLMPKEAPFPPGKAWR